MVKSSSILSIAIVLLVWVSLGEAKTQVNKAKPETITCYNRGSKCFLKKVYCPIECPNVQPKEPNAKGCFLDCYSPKCETVCRNRKPNCDGPGAACYDPRFIGGDGIVFYFHGKSNEHFSLISDANLQINARFIGLRPPGRPRDYTWIQALGLMFSSHKFSLEATKTEKWDNEIDHLQFSYNGEALIVPRGLYSTWNSPNNELIVERASSKNSVTVTVPELVEIRATVVPVSEQENKIHNYQIPSNDSFAHLEVQFRFIGLSSVVEGVLGRTYRPDFKNPAKPGVAMAVVGGDDKYRTSSLLSTDCTYCVFSPEKNAAREGSMALEYGTLDCTRGIGGGNGIVCRK
ncbi:late embryogenesis abundant (LEA) protein-like protein [Actinidia rufa]|uniref:Late embryogenesis abundant (LEA) protein-like protein n=1 Tax=Actinidia rufa TaxID=165716 RepID=A0A7J0EZD9_9ERIC|nr:late embryogenesis abundant (LEA) protein-like protein [Actinidia rufa]